MDINSKRYKKRRQTLSNQHSNAPLHSPFPLPYPDIEIAIPVHITSQQTLTRFPDTIHDQTNNPYKMVQT